MERSAVDEEVFTTDGGPQLIWAWLRWAVMGEKAVDNEVSSPAMTPVRIRMTKVFMFDDDGEIELLIDL